MSSVVPRFDAERARAASMRTRYNEIREALEQVRTRAQSRDRTLSIDMGVGGAVLAVNLTDQAMSKSPQALAQLLLETINAGMQEIASITNEVVSPFVSSAHLNLQAITSGQLPKIAEAPARNGYAREIEEASAIPKRRLGAYGKAFGTAAGNTPQTTRYTSEEEDGNG